MVALVGLLYTGQRSLLYPAPAGVVPEQLPSGIERVDFEPGYGFLLAPKERTVERAPLIIYAHGNAELALWSVDAFDAPLKRGFAVLIVEYPGYGGAPGDPTFESIRGTILAAYDAMVARPDIDPDRIIAYGRSMGGAAASLLASERPVAALGLESTFSSLPELVEDFYVPGALVRDRFDNLSIVATLDIPVFVFHGSLDSVIPVEHGIALSGAGKDVTYLEAACGHDDCIGPWPEFMDFVERKVLTPR